MSSSSDYSEKHESHDEEIYEPQSPQHAEEEEKRYPRRSRSERSANNSTRSRSRSRSLGRSISRTNIKDVDREYRIQGNAAETSEESDNALELASTYSKNVITFLPGDPENPYNWSSTAKVLIVLLGVVTVVNSTLGSAIPSTDIGPLSEHYGVTVQAQQVLPNSVFLIGYVPGPLLFSPLSESFGRQYVMIGTFLGYMAFTLGTCLAPTWYGFLIFRFLTGVFASSPISVTGGIYADLYDDPVARGRAMALFMTATTWGPIASPIAAGYLSAFSWQWPFWFCLIFAGATVVPLFFLPETYGPIILQRRARKMRKEAGPNSNIWAPLDLETTTTKEVITVFLGRPFRMLFFEAIVIFSCLFLSFIYAIQYILYQVFPLIFPPVYGFTPGEEGLAFLGIGVGAIFACGIYLWWDAYLRKAQAQHKPWAEQEEFRRLPLACIGGPLFTIGVFWIGWTARPDIHWIVPILGGVPYGAGFLLLFMALINYLVDAYRIFAASAVGAASSARSLFGAILPFAGRPLYERLGIAWGSSLLGFLCVAMCVIPFVFIKYGPAIRARSAFCQELEAKQREKDEVDEKRRQRQMRRMAESDAAAKEAQTSVV